MNLNLKIWRQKNAKTKEQMVDYPVNGIDGDMSFLEMLGRAERGTDGTKGEDPL